MKKLILPFLFYTICTLHLLAQNPETHWMQYTTPEEAGWSSDKLAFAKSFADSIGSAAFMIIEDGKIVKQWGETERRFMCHSVRKSLLTTLYGIYVDNGTINLNNTLSELGIDDTHQLSTQEKTATIQNLLQARSGVYHPAAYETEAMAKARPKRESHAPGTFWYYNNWDFNTSCSILMQHTNKDFFEDFNEQIAQPLQMQDFRLSDGYYHLEAEHSKYPAYPFRMSSRDLARIGQLYLQNGKWNEKQLISKDWVKESTTTYSENTREAGRGYAYMWWTGIYGNKHKNYSAQGVGNQAIIVFPEDNVIMVNRANTYLGKSVKTADLQKLTQLIWEAKTGAVKSNPKLIPAQSDLQEYVGNYDAIGDATITINNGQLQMKDKLFGTFELLPISKDLFKIKDANVLLQFHRNPDGSLKKEATPIRKPIHEMIKLPEPKANPNNPKYASDVQSIDNILAALYDVISGDKGVKRDWDRFKNLFVKEARLVPSGKNKEGQVGYQMLSPEGYIKRSGKYLEENGFHEVEIHRVIEKYGSLVHVFSTYESYHKKSDTKPFMRGINSIQLMNDGKRWWIMQIYWLGETEALPLPERYLPKGE